MIQIICDRCGQKLTPGQNAGYVSLSFWNQKDPDMWDLVGQNPCEHMHFCGECMAKIQAFVMETGGGDE